MEEPRIIYGKLEQPVHTNARYLLMKANLENKTYPTPEFIKAIENVSLDDVTKKECRHDIEVQRSFLKNFAMIGNTVTIKNFYPDKRKIENFVNTTFNEMYDNLHRGEK